MSVTMFDTDKWRQPYHPSRRHPRRDLTLRYFEIVFSVVVIVFAFPYIFRVSPSLVASSKYHERPDAAKNAYFVLSMLFGFVMVRLVPSSPIPNCSRCQPSSRSFCPSHFPPQQPIHHPTQLTSPPKKTALTIIICAVRIWLLHFRPDRDPNTSSSLNQFNASPNGSQKFRWTLNRSRTNQDSGLLLFWIMSLIWWNVARLLHVGTQYPVVSDLLEIIISIIVVLQL